MVTTGGTPPPSDSTPPGRRGIAMVVLVGVAALAVFVLASRPDPPPSPTTVPQAVAGPTTTTTDPAPSATIYEAGPPWTAHLPEVTGALVTAIDDASSRRLLVWPAGSEQTEQDIPMVSHSLEFDRSGRRLAFLGHSATEGDALYTGHLARWQPLATRVTSFRWHSTRPASLAWTELGRGLCRVDVDLEGSIVTGQSCLADVPGDLVGFDESGFLLVDQNEVVRLAGSGEEVGRVPGIDAKVAPDGTLLIIDRNADGDAMFSVAAPDLSGMTQLDWAPANAIGEYGFVAWSPANPLQLAFLTMSDNGWFGMERWSLDGYRQNSLQVGARLWDITWDDTGRYLLAPGEVPGEENLIYVFDTFTNHQSVVTFDDTIQDTQLVVESKCQEAGFLSEDWPPGRLPQGVGSTGYQMVLSRNAGLESWYFLSARLHGGDHDGEIATWALPGYSGQGEYPLSPIPANEAAIGRAGPGPWEPEPFGVEDWMDLDGAAMSQWCVETLVG